MAKKSKEEAYQAFMAEVLAAVPEDKRGVVEATFKDVAEVVSEKVMARSEFSRSMDEARQAREAADKLAADVAAKEQALKGRTDEWTGWYEGELKERSKLQEQLDAYQEQFGDLDGTGKKGTVEHKGLTREDMQAELAARDQAAIALADVMTDIKIRHNRDFGESLVMGDVIKLATEKGVPLATAYDLFVAPKVAERSTADVEKRIAAAKEEGAREALSKHKLPIAPSYSEPHAMDATQRLPEGDRIAAAVAGFASAGSK